MVEEEEGKKNRGCWHQRPVRRKMGEREIEEEEEERKKLPSRPKQDHSKWEYTHITCYYWALYASCIAIRGKEGGGETQ